VEAVVRSGATWLSLRRAVKSIFALKRVRVSVRVSYSECRTVSPRS